VLAAFLGNGAVLAGWVPQIPQVKARLALADGELGLSLFGSAAGGILALPLSAWAVGHLGSRTVTFVTGFLYCLMLPLLPHAWSWWSVSLLLVLFGGCHGAMDVAMNAQAVAVETARRRPSMSSFHACYSLGNFASAGIGGLLLGAGLGAGWVVLAIALAVAAGFALMLPGLLPGAGGGRGADKPPPRRWRRPSGILLALGALCFAVLLGEEAMQDWSTVFLRFERGQAPALAAWGYTAFAAAMAAGRLLGDRLVERLGAVALVRAGALLAAAGLAGALLAPWAAATIAGFAAVGFGIANVVPLLFGAAGRVNPARSGDGIATVAVAGYAAFLGGPLLIGFVADHLSLSAGLAVVVLSLLTVAVAAGIAGRAAPPGSRGAPGA
jgi:predicted MFS family arabinose efflux permease